MGADREECAKERLTIVPFMEEYDLLRQYLAPYICQSNPPSYKGKAIETDGLGFRISHWKDRRVDSSTWFEFKDTRKAIVTGGSVGFGWGATANERSLASCLSCEMDIPVQNLGIMSANSTQEFIAGIPFYLHADYVVSVTGVNTFVCGMLSSPTFFDLYGSYYAFNNQLWEDIHRHDLLMLRWLVSEHVDPNDYFKSKAQKRAFETFRFGRLRNRLLSSLGLRQPSQKNSASRSPEEAFQYSLDVSCRDIHNMHNTVGENRYLCAIQAHVAVLKRTPSMEEKRLAELAKVLMRPDMYVLSFDTMPAYWDRYVRGIQCYCDEHGIACIDLNELDYKGWCFVDSSHYSDRGAEIAARAIATKLTEGPQ